MSVVKLAPIKVYYVIGQEGSGTYMMANSITEAGGLEGYDVYRRSVPHAHKWPSIKENIIQIINSGNPVIPIIIIREMEATLNSVNNRDETRILTSEDYHARLHYIMQQTDLFSREIEIITYEAFVGSEDFRRSFFSRIGLPYPEKFGIFDGNAKYYQEEEK